VVYSNAASSNCRAAVHVRFAEKTTALMPQQHLQLKSQQKDLGVVDVVHLSVLALLRVQQCCHYTLLTNQKAMQ
jgi:hypothetical protein